MTEKMTRMTQFVKEEIANAITHGIGAILSIPALIILIIHASKHGTASAVIAFTVYGVSMFLLYLFSTLLHSIHHPKVEKIFTILDHSAIYLLIAGTYTPFLLITLRGPLGWTLLAIIWTLAIGGIVFKIFFVRRFIKASTLCYIIMGWLIIVAIKPLYENLTGHGFSLLLAGGILYSVGAIFFLWEKLPFNHAIWHLFVLGGSAMMFFCVLFYVLPTA
ncbi:MULTISPECIES: PAQR family membrane homeostasis protein TrhA [Bacillus]|uniref:PAQR family membrane homeostasis protein TrhA n=1 Tax=Bacillus TaxID=1386 RepID=UPI00046FFABD|nr:hemolysin III family protein [Bacillus cereus]MDA2437793.1 hemolysin III family protein [Bacillus cereus]MDA2443184.1 hemolysin III family protein [Bacillus cereus]MDA2701281.1 hemolysin III family protein [Bacillus cereus]MDA2706861.1 hemolysin III family protein [Bacillus cereus]UUN19576.1 hemolysin III family protein [Bacillus cereus]